MTKMTTKNIKKNNANKNNKNNENEEYVDGEDYDHGAWQAIEAEVERWTAFLGIQVEL